jgi:predicted metal-dependent HD superfamily phosphohydrolase
MNFEEAKQFILERLNHELPKDLYYHGLHHTIDVCNSVEELAKAENINGDLLVLLKTAALFHDSGFIQQYINNEPVAVSLVEKYLPQFGYTKEQIAIIGKIILSTRIPQQPSNHAEEIMCDADLDYLGRDDFFQISETLKKEWLAYGIIKSEEEYNHKQVRFFDQHNYFTKTAKQIREPKKQKHLAELKKKI